MKQTTIHATLNPPRLCTLQDALMSRPERELREIARANFSPIKKRKLDTATTLAHDLLDRGCHVKIAIHAPLD